jgi:hypothetical protein
MGNNSLRELALNVLEKRDSAWDSRGTVAKTVSQGGKHTGTAKSESTQAVNPTVPLSHTLGTGTLGHPQKTGTAPGTLVGQFDAFPFADALNELERGCPEHIDPERWQQCLVDAQHFIMAWGDQALTLGWTAEELFGLHTPSAKPHPSYCRLSRYDCTGLVWSLQGRRVVALSSDTAAVEGRTGNVLIYRKHNKPAYGPLGDSLDDFIA